MARLAAWVVALSSNATLNRTKRDIRDSATKVLNPLRTGSHLLDDIPPRVEALSGDPVILGG
jgi:hypothetical protein